MWPFTFTGKKGLDQRKMIDNIKEMCTWGENIDIVVAYLKSSGYSLIRNFLKGKHVRILLGFDFWLTDVDPLLKIFDEGYQCKVYKTPLSDDEKSYHPKIYISRKKNELRVLIGSFNLTSGGLYSNVEGNILLSGSDAEVGIRDVLEFFEEKWNSTLSQELNLILINKYAGLKRDYETHTQKIHLDSLFTSEKEEISSKGNSVIVCMTKDHDRNSIYNRLIGVPINSKKIAFENIKKGTRLFIYYKSYGISKIVEAVSDPYIDEAVINEWKDGLPETYPVRVKTRLLRQYTSSIKLGRLQELGICRVDTGNKIVSHHLRSSLTPISDNDGDTIENELNLLDGIHESL